MEYNNPNLNININPNPNKNRIKAKLNKKNQIPRMDIKTSNFNMMNSSKIQPNFYHQLPKKVKIRIIQQIPKIIKDFFIPKKIIISKIII